MTGNRKGEIATFLTIGTLVVLSVATIISSLALRKNYTYKSKAAGRCFFLTADVYADQVNNSWRFRTAVKVNSPEGGGDGHIQFFINGASQGTMWPWNKGVNNPFVIIDQYTQPQTLVNGETRPITYAVKVDECNERGNYETLACGFAVNNDTPSITGNNCNFKNPPAPRSGRGTCIYSQLEGVQTVCYSGVCKDEGDYSCTFNTNCVYDEWTSTSRQVNCPGQPAPSNTPTPTSTPVPKQGNNPSPTPVPTNTPTPTPKLADGDNYDYDSKGNIIVSISSDKFIIPDGADLNEAIKLLKLKYGWLPTDNCGKAVNLKYTPVNDIEYSRGKFNISNIDRFNTYSDGKSKCSLIYKIEIFYQLNSYLPNNPGKYKESLIIKDDIVFDATESLNKLISLDETIDLRPYIQSFYIGILNRRENSSLDINKVEIYFDKPVNNQGWLSVDNLNFKNIKYNNVLETSPTYMFYGYPKGHTRLKITDGYLKENKGIFSLQGREFNIKGNNVLLIIN